MPFDNRERHIVLPPMTAPCLLAQNEGKYLPVVIRNSQPRPCSPDSVDQTKPNMHKSLTGVEEAHLEGLL